MRQPRQHTESQDAAQTGTQTASSHHNINRPEDIELHAGEYLTITKGA